VDAAVHTPSEKAYGAPDFLPPETVTTPRVASAYPLPLGASTPKRPTKAMLAVEHAYRPRPGKRSKEWPGAVHADSNATGAVDAARLLRKEAPAKHPRAAECLRMCIEHDVFGLTEKDLGNILCTGSLFNDAIVRSLQKKIRQNTEDRARQTLQGQCWLLSRSGSGRIRWKGIL
jgi:hypothetical protein